MAELLNKSKTQYEEEKSRFHQEIQQFHQNKGYLICCNQGCGLELGWTRLFWLDSNSDSNSVEQKIGLELGLG